MSPPLFNVIDFYVFRCYKGVDQTWMSLNYTPFLLLVKSKKRCGEGGEEESRELYVVSRHVCVRLSSVGMKLYFFFFFLFFGGAVPC